LAEADRVQDLSQDGNWYLTIKIDKRTEDDTESHVSLAKKDGSEVRRLSDAKQRAGWARFSPDGRRALYTAHEGPLYTAREGAKTGQRVFVVDLPEGKPRPVSPELNAYIRDVCWSPDGKRIAYAWHQLRDNYDDDQNEYVLSLIDADGKNPVTLRTDRGRAGPAVHLDWP
jgi:Tol biopolymer transport system component